MIERPARLHDWTLDLVHELASSGKPENDWFDLKGNLQGQPEQQRKIVAAFANTQGGVLVFGVTNGREVSGVANAELPRDFGNKLTTGISPSVAFRFAEPFIVSETASVWICEIPRSQRGPHAVLVNEQWVFPRRTESGSNVSMNVEEIRLAFQDTEGRRVKLALLASELSHVDWVAERLLRELPENASTIGLVNDWAWMTRYPTLVIDTILGDAYSLLVDKTDLAVALTLIRDETRRSNEVAAVYSNYAFIRSTGDPQQRNKLYKLMRAAALSIRENVRHARKMVDSVLSGNYGRLVDVSETNQGPPELGEPGSRKT